MRAQIKRRRGCLQQMAATSVVLLQFPSRKGYTRRELCYLAVCLGYPSSLFPMGFKTAPGFQAALQRLDSGKRVSEKVFLELLDSKILLHDRLDKLYNRYPAKYNVKLIKRAHYLLKHGTLSFSDVSDARIAFELYACEDGSGLQANVGTVRQALKMLERVMSPLRLEAEVQKYHEISEIPNRFQVFEFLDLVVMCETTQEVEKRVSSTCSLGNTNDTDLGLPDFNEILMTPDQKISKYLDEQYQASLLSLLDPTPAVLDADHIVDGAARRALLSRSSEQSRAITPSLEHSTSQLKQTRGGSLVLSKEQFSACVLKVQQVNSHEMQPAKYPLADPPTENGRKGHGKLHRRKALQFRFKRVPRMLPTAEQNPTKIALKNAATTPELDVQKHEQNSIGHVDRERDLSHTIDSLCVASVLRAREALRTSFDSAQAHQVALETTYSTTDGAPAAVDTKSLGYSKRWSHTDSAGLPRGTPGQPARLQVAPVVSRQEWMRHQGLMDDLEWRTLRREFAVNKQRQKIK